jgi:hypothetical protein
MPETGNSDGPQAKTEGQPFSLVAHPFCHNLNSYFIASTIFPYMGTFAETVMVNYHSPTKETNFHLQQTNRSFPFPFSICSN